MSDDNECHCPPELKTLCNGDRVYNMWVEGGVPSQGTGNCLLDTMTEEQVLYTLNHNPRAARDLARVTTDPVLRQMAAEVPLLPTVVEEDEIQKETNRHKEPGSIPFYAIFRGQPPFAQ